MKGKQQWDEAVSQAKEGDISSFEVIYILSYTNVCKRIISIVKREQYLWDLMYDVYKDVYENIKDMPEGEKAKEWILSLAEEKSKKLIEEKGKPAGASSRKFKMNEERAATVILKLEEDLGILKEQEKESNKYILATKVIMTLSLICLCSFFVNKIYVIIKANNEVTNNIIFEVRKVTTDYEELSTKETLINETEIESDQAIADNLKIEAGWGITEEGYVYLVDDKLLNVIGSYETETHNFYFDEKGNLINLRTKADLAADINNTVQSDQTWLYYLLPSSETKKFDLFRISDENKSKSWKECVLNKITDYYVTDDMIFYMVDSELKVITNASNQNYLVEEHQLHLIKEEDGFYVANELGYIANEDLKDTHLQIEDRICRIVEGRVKYVKQNVLPVKGVTYYINSEDSFLYWKNTRGESGRFVGEGVFINSFCIVDQWVYYSVCTRVEADKRYSEIRRISTDGTVREVVSAEFPGNMLNMYFYQNKREIYAEYIPEKNQYGKIAVIALDGSISVIDDLEERVGMQTTGQDTLELLDVKGQDIYCYWHDCDWKNKNGVQILWTKPIILSDQKRVPIS